MMRPEDVARHVELLDGVRRSSAGGLVAWRYHGRLVARQLDESRLVIRTGFAEREALVGALPETFSVPARFAAHMMVVADLVDGERTAIEAAIDAAWLLQREAD